MQSLSKKGQGAVMLTLLVVIVIGLLVLVPVVANAVQSSNNDYTTFNTVVLNPAYTNTGNLSSPTSPYGLANDSKFLFAADYGTNTVSVYYLSNNSFYKNITADLHSPFDLLIANGDLYVTNNATATVSIYKDNSSFTFLKNVSTGKYPEGLAYAGGYVFAQAFSNVTKINSTNTGVATYSLASFSDANWLTTNGSWLYAVNGKGNTVSAFNLAGNSEKNLTVDTNPRYDAVSGLYLYVTNFGTGNLLKEWANGNGTVIYNKTGFAEPFGLSFYNTYLIVNQYNGNNATVLYANNGSKTAYYLNGKDQALSTFASNGNTLFSSATTQNTIYRWTLTALTKQVPTTNSTVFTTLDSYLPLLIVLGLILIVLATFGLRG